MFVQNFGQAIGMPCMCWVSLTPYQAYVLTLIPVAWGG